MKDSLRLSILKFLRANERMSIQDLEMVCHREGRKVDNGTRRLREMRDREHPSYNPRIEGVENDKGAIIAYTYTPSPYERMNTAYKSGETQQPIIRQLF